MSGSTFFKFAGLHAAGLPNRQPARRHRPGEACGGGVPSVAVGGCDLIPAPSLFNKSVGQSIDQFVEPHPKTAPPFFITARSVAPHVIISYAMAW